MRWYKKCLRKTAQSTTPCQRPKWRHVPPCSYGLYSSTWRPRSSNSTTKMSKITKMLVALLTCFVAFVPAFLCENSAVNSTDYSRKIIELHERRTSLISTGNVDTTKQLLQTVRFFCFFFLFFSWAMVSYFYSCFVHVIFRLFILYNLFNNWFDFRSTLISMLGTRFLTCNYN